MTTEKPRSTQTRGKQPTQGAKHPGAPRKAGQQSPQTSGAPVLKQDAPPIHGLTRVDRHVQRMPSVAPSAPPSAPKPSKPTQRNSKAVAQPTQPKRATPWTIADASRVGSATARNGDGNVKKGSFAAEAMSKAMKREHSLKKEK